MLCFLTTTPSGSMYKLKRTGPIMEPCGTPQVIAIFSEEESPMEIKNSRQVRYDLNQSKTISDRPTQCSSLCIRISWSTVSKASLRSRRTRAERLFKVKLSPKSNQGFICDVNMSQTWKLIFNGVRGHWYASIKISIFKTHKLWEHCLCTQN